MALRQGRPQPTGDALRKVIGITAVGHAAGPFIPEPKGRMAPGCPQDSEIDIDTICLENYQSYFVGLSITSDVASHLLRHAVFYTVVA